MKGNVLESYQFDNSTKEELSIEEFQAGTYLLNIVSAEKQIKKLFIKKG